MQAMSELASALDLSIPEKIDSKFLKCSNELGDAIDTIIPAKVTHHHHYATVELFTSQISSLATTMIKANEQALHNNLGHVHSMVEAAHSNAAESARKLFA